MGRINFTKETILRVEYFSLLASKWKCHDDGLFVRRSKDSMIYNVHSELHADQLRTECSHHGFGEQDECLWA